MAVRRRPEAASSPDAPPPELIGRAQIKDWVSPGEWAACHIDEPNHHVTGGNQPWLRASALAHRRQREARQRWAAERGLVRIYKDWANADRAMEQ